MLWSLSEERTRSKQGRNNGSRKSTRAEEELLDLYQVLQEHKEVLRGSIEGTTIT